MPITDSLEYLDDEFISLLSEYDLDTSSFVCSNFLVRCSRKYKLRKQIIEHAVVMQSKEWQSPPIIAHSSIHELNTNYRAEEISIFNFDYKRENHYQGLEYEESFSKQLKKNLGNHRTQSFLTSSGMSSIALAIALLESESVNQLMCAGGIYFETQLLLKRKPHIEVLSLGNISEDDLLEQIEESRPRAVFLETTSNDEFQRSYDIPYILSSLSKFYDEPIFFIVDATCNPLALWKDKLHLSENIAFICIESVLKYWQLGMDLTNAGILTTIGNSESFDTIRELRARNGLNISDFTASLLPKQNVNRLTDRINLAGTHANKFVDSVRSLNPNIKLAYSNSERYSPSTIVGIPFHLSPTDLRNTFEVYMNKCHAEGLPLSFGTSFGFDCSRVYLPSPSSSETKSYLRFALGLEPEEIITRYAELLCKTFSD